MEKEKKPKRKIGVIVLMVIMILILLLCLVQCQSCSGDTDPTGNTTTPTGEPTTEGAGSSDPSTEVTTPSEDVTEPSGEATEPSTAPSEPSTEVTEPSTDTTEPSTDTTEPSKHTHSYTETKTAPGCETEGYTTYTCACGDTFTGDTVSAAGHSWGEWVTTKEPTMSATGSAERSCSDCPAKETKTLGKIIPSHTHKYSSKVTKAATCTTEGVRTFTCSCGSSYTEKIAKRGHDYISEVTIAPTASSEGVRTFTCSCGAKYTESIPKTDQSSVTSPECEWRGCSYIRVEIIDATHTVDGYEKWECCYCGDSFKSPIYAEGHSYATTVNKAPTCITAGTATYTCICGDTYTETVSATGHSYRAITIIERTCTTDGYEKWECTTCGEVSETVYPHGHSWEIIPCADSTGHWEPCCVCLGDDCDWISTESEAQAAGYSSCVKYWADEHVKSFPVSDRRYHSYDQDSVWVVDCSEEPIWICTRCGEKTATFLCNDFYGEELEKAGYPGFS